MVVKVIFHIQDFHCCKANKANYKSKDKNKKLIKC